MGKLAVSLLEMDYNNLGQELKEIENSGIDYIHIDMMDGMFVPNVGIGTRLIQGIRPSTKLVFDVHMMVQEPERLAEKVVNSGADVITVHYEACKDIKKTLEFIQDLGCKAGIDLNPETPLDVLDDELLKKADVIHLMTTVPGVEGQKFIPESLDKIRSLRRKLEELKLDTDIEVDGNITKENLRRVVKAGATIFVSGRAIVQGDMAENIRQMKTIIQAAEKEENDEVRTWN